MRQKVAYKYSYVHYHVQNVDPTGALMEQFSERKREQKGLALITTYNQRLKKTYNINSTDKEYMELLDSIQEGIKKGMDKKIISSTEPENLYSPEKIDTDKYTADLSKIKNNMEDFEKFLTQMEEVNKKLGVVFNDEILTRWVDDLIINTRGQELNIKFYNDIKNRFMAENNGVLIKYSPKQVEKDTVNLKNKITSLKFAAAIIQNRNDFNASSDFWESIHKMFVVNVNRLAQSLLVPTIETAINYGMSQIGNQLASIGKTANITVTRNDGTTKVKYAEDLSSLLKKEILKTANLKVEIVGGLNGSIRADIKVPQIRTAPFKPESSKKRRSMIQLQKYVSLGEIFNRSDLTPFEIKGIVNILAHANHSAEYLAKVNSPNLFDGSSRNAVYNYIRTANILNALVGSMQDDDFTYFMVMGDKITSIHELLHEIIVYKRVLLTHRISPSQQTFVESNEQYDDAKGAIRSARTYRMITNAMFSTKLKMNLLR